MSALIWAPVLVIALYLLNRRRRRKVAQRPEAVPVVHLVTGDPVPRIPSGRFPGHRGSM